MSNTKNVEKQNNIEDQNDLELSSTQLRINYVNLEQKIKWLRTKWTKPSRYAKRSDEHDMMGLLVYPGFKRRPIFDLVIADKLSEFQLEYIDNPKDMPQYFMMACLCGSQKIAEYMLTCKLNSSYETYQEPDMLGHIAASPNHKWAKEIAQLFASKKFPMSKSIYRLTHGEITRQIIAIYKDQVSAIK